jgi:hypothetical protein
VRDSLIMLSSELFLGNNPSCKSAHGKPSCQNGKGHVDPTSVQSTYTGIVNEKK